MSHDGIECNDGDCIVCRVFAKFTTPKERYEALEKDLEVRRVLGTVSDEEDERILEIMDELWLELDDTPTPRSG